MAVDFSLKDSIVGNNVFALFDKDWNTNNSLPTEVGNYRLTTDVTLTETWQVPEGIVNLDLNCHYIKLADDKKQCLKNICRFANFN